MQVLLCSVHSRIHTSQTPCPYHVAQEPLGADPSVPALQLVGSPTFSQGAQRAVGWRMLSLGATALLWLMQPLQANTPAESYGQKCYVLAMQQ